MVVIYMKVSQSSYLLTWEASPEKSPYVLLPLVHLGLLMNPPQEKQGLLQALVLFLFLIPSPLRPVVMKWVYFVDLCLCGTQENRLG